MTAAIPDPEPKPGSAVERSAAKLVDALLNAVRDGVGPMTGAAAYGEERRKRYGGDPEKRFAGSSPRRRQPQQRAASLQAWAVS